MNAYDTDYDSNKIKKIDQSHWKFSGKITIHDTSRFNHITNSIDFHKQIIFDLTDTEYMNSSFLGFLIEINQMANSSGGSLEIVITEKIGKLFTLLHLNDFFNIHLRKDKKPQIN